MLEKINWFVWLVLVILWNYGFPQATPIQDVIVAVILSILFIIIKMFQLRYLKKKTLEVNLIKNEEALIMGIHYDYKSTRGDKAMKKEAKEKLVLNREEQKGQAQILKSQSKTLCMTSINLSLLRI